MNIGSIMRAVSIATLVCCALPVLARQATQKTFATPEDAVVALVDSAKSNNTRELLAILGPEGENVISSGDDLMDQSNRDVFLIAYAQRAALMTVSPTRRVLYVGYEDWPVPIPLVKDGKAWRFDTAAGAKEILFRRIGRNELHTIDVCHAYVEAQREYAATAHDGQPVGTYAQRIASTPGKHDGLYWNSDDPEQLSPLGQFAAEATDEANDHGEDTPVPFHGYLFRPLTSEGSSAPGGPRNYIVNGAMRGGFALLAYPASYRVSGVMSFIVNQDNVVYQKDLGPDTAKIAAGIRQFDPASGWQVVP